MPVRVVVKDAAVTIPKELLILDEKAPQFTLPAPAEIEVPVTAPRTHTPPVILPFIPDTQVVNDTTVVVPRSVVPVVLLPLTPKIRVLEEETLVVSKVHTAPSIVSFDVSTEVNYLFLYFSVPLSSCCASISSFSLEFGLLRSFWC